MSVVFTPKLEKQIIDLYQDTKLSIREIAVKTGASKSHIHRLLKRLNVETRPKHVNSLHSGYTGAEHIVTRTVKIKLKGI